MRVANGIKPSRSDIAQIADSVMAGKMTKDAEEVNLALKGGSGVKVTIYLYIWIMYLNFKYNILPISVITYAKSIHVFSGNHRDSGGCQSQGHSTRKENGQRGEEAEDYRKS